MNINKNKKPPMDANKKSLLDKLESSIKNIDKQIRPSAIHGHPIEGVIDYEGNGIPNGDDELEFGAVLEEAIDVSDADRKRRDDILKAKSSSGRKMKNEIKKDLGIKPSKQSAFPTRSDAFLGTNMRSLNVILNHKVSEIYKDGADPCPRILMGIPAYGKPCKKNAFEHFIKLQEKLREFRGQDPANAPPWIIINNDTSVITDRNIITRLEALLPTTGVAAAYGFERIRASGRWYDVTQEDQERIRGCYIQGAMDGIDWDFIVGSKFKQSPRYRVVIAHGPFIAIRGPLFMSIDFKDAAEKYKGAFWHYMAELSMEAIKRKFAVATIKTTAIQYDNMNDAKFTEDFIIDQGVFTSKWQSVLPMDMLINR